MSDDEYEYAVQWVSKEGGRTINPASYDWDDLRTALRNQARNQRRIQGRFNFVVVRRRKAGPLEQIMITESGDVVVILNA